MDSIPDFIRRKHNPKLITYLDPRLKEILSMSYGVITYQDDVLLTAIHIAGYNWEEADKLRKAMGKKIPAEMAAQKEKFLTGCVKNGLTKEKSNDLWKLIEPFAAYGFNKAHAASYAIVAYQTAYLKANYPVEFMTAVLTAESGNTETIAEAVTECAKMGIMVLPPDVNSSGASFTYIDDKTIRFGLLAVKNLGSDMIDGVIAERQANGPFLNVTDFSSRIATKSFNKKSLEALIMSGAMDCLGERNQLLASVEQILSFHKNAMHDIDSGQVTLFSSAPRLNRASEIVLRVVPAATKREKLAWERELLGLYVSAHPFKEYADYFDGLLTSIGSLDATKHKSGLVLVGGIIMESKQIMTKKNDAMAFIRLEDVSGAIEVVVFPSVYKLAPASWAKDAPVLVYGKFEEREGEKKILCEKVRPLTNENLEASRSELAFAMRAGGAPATVGTS
ncbi:MAG: OB-fold nucleic acid binding domain-containing protein, partial [Patescibacteria group bacterium]